VIGESFTAMSSSKGDILERDILERDIPKGDILERGYTPNKHFTRQVFGIANTLPVDAKIEFWEAILAFLEKLEKSPNFSITDNRKKVYPLIVEYWLQTWELTSFLGKGGIHRRIAFFRYILVKNEFTVSADGFFPEELGIVGAKHKVGVFIPFLVFGIAYPGFVVLSFKNGIIKGLLKKLFYSSVNVKVRLYCEEGVPYWVSVEKRVFSDLVSYDPEKNKSIIRN
jgi:hypothetical protein